MKTPEDEAFDELAKRQGHWGGGFPAKRQMAADKLQEFCTCHETHPMECQGCRASRLAQPAKEPVSFPCCGYTDANAIRWNQFNGVVQCHMCGQVYTVAQPVQGEQGEEHMKDEALKLALEAYLCREMPAGTVIGDPKWWAAKIANAIKADLAQPAQEQWNAALDEAANRISEIAAFPKTTQDSFAVFIRGLKK